MADFECSSVFIISYSIFYFPNSSRLFLSVSLLNLIIKWYNAWSFQCFKKYQSIYLNAYSYPKDDCLFFSVQYYVFLTISTPSPLSLYFFYYLWNFVCARPPIFPLLLFSLFVIYNSYILRPPVIYIVKSLFFTSNFWRYVLDFFLLVFALNLVNVNKL